MKINIVTLALTMMALMGLVASQEPAATVLKEAELEVRRVFFFIQMQPL